MKKNFTALLCALLLSTLIQAQEHEKDRLKHAGEVLQEILNIPDDLPKSVLDKSECVIVIPSVKKFAIGIGGNYGRGAMTCRAGANFTGAWGPPAMVALEGGNIGFQLGGQATDVLMHAEILTYSRSRGLFAGISLDGSTLRPDNSASEKVYGRKISAREIVIQHKVGTPAEGQLLVSTLQKASPTNKSDPKSLQTGSK